MDKKNPGGKTYDEVYRKITSVKLYLKRLDR